MSGKNCSNRQQGISNLVVALVLVAVAAVGGSFVFASFYTQMQHMSRNTSLRTRSIDVISTGSGDLVSAMVKNNGTVVLDNVKVKIMNQQGGNATLHVGYLPPGQTGSDHGSGDWGFKPGRTYPVLVTAKGPEGAKVVSKAMSVRASD